MIRALENVPVAARGARVAVLIPCYNEAPTIGTVVRRFRQVLPQADIYVFDNGSTDDTAEAARAAGATVIDEPRRGKGHVVQSMFRKVDADVYVMVDGDDTYPAEVVEALIAPISDGQADMVIGSRLHRSSQSRFRPLNRLGNAMFRALLGLIFRVRLTDLLSGYRSFSRRLVRTVPLFGGGFETETEMTIKALHRGFRIVEVPVDLVARPEGSHSKIRLVHDGVLILTTILALFRDYKPLTFFGGLGLLLILGGAAPGLWAGTHWSAEQVPLVLLAAVLALAGVVSVAAGLVLHTVARHFQELDLHLQTLRQDRDDREDGPRARA
jgi:glycosyltransferase involved in cell wall biosynthesis